MKRAIAFTSRHRHVGALVLVVLTVFLAHLWLRAAYATLIDAYEGLVSDQLLDRRGAPILTHENALGHFGVRGVEYPEQLRMLVIRKEDQWFYYHPGVNPIRTLEAMLVRLLGRDAGGASTITQQLAKTLLGNTTERTIANKLRELVAATALEYGSSKDEILTMYLDTAYLGGRTQGFATAASTYFGKAPSDLSESEMLSLVTALSSPSRVRPLTQANREAAQDLAASLGTTPPLFTDPVPAGAVVGSRFELESMGLTSGSDGVTTVDEDLTKRLRALLARHLEKHEADGMTHGAIVVIKVPENELLAIIGSPAPYSGREGMDINMAIAPRPIGSTIKPFIYLKAFETGLRPYTKVEDREFKYDVATGFPIYPRNYDGQYRGTVTLHESLQNSLNVPTVEVLRYVSLPTFYSFLGNTLALQPRQEWSSYAYGIALGGLELDLLSLTHAFTVFPKGGTLDPLTVTRDGVQVFTPPSSELRGSRRVADERHVALVNAILMDRAGAVEQFGAAGSLYLSRDGYAVKTGTSRDYHDSWTIGYTPEYVVGVWVGNAKNTPMRRVSGMAGAGAVWHDVMELVFTTPYDTGEKLAPQGLTTVPTDKGYSWGLPGEDTDTIARLLMRLELITYPHDGDEFELTEGMAVPLRASEPVTWTCACDTQGDTTYFTPTEAGEHTIRATTLEGRTESIRVRVRVQGTPPTPAP